MSASDLEFLDLDRDLPTTAEDIAVLRRLRYTPRPIDFATYLRFLASLPEPTWEQLRAKRGPHGEPFEL